MGLLDRRMEGLSSMAATRWRSLEYRSSWYVPEEPYLYTYLTGPEYLHSSAACAGYRRGARVKSISSSAVGIYDVGIRPCRHTQRYAQSLDRRRVSSYPRIVILDEPFSGLDVSAARVLKAFVRALAAEGKIVVFSSHVLEVVEQVCSRVIILKNGRIVGHDSVDNLRNTLKLPSLDAVFATLVAEENIERRTVGLISAMHLQ